MASTDGKLFDDLFTVTTLDKGGKKFDRVSRIEATSAGHAMSMTLDINMDLFPLGPGDRITMLLASSLHGAEEAKKSSGAGADGDAVGEDDVEDRREAWRGGDEGLAADYDYVTYGKIYKFEDIGGAEKDATVYISFGGLLMALRGNYRHLSNIVVGDNVYCLIRK